MISRAEANPHVDDIVSAVMSASSVIVVTPSTGLTLTKGIPAENSAAIESFEKMTAAVIGREKMVLGNLVNNNNVKSRITQFSKSQTGWRPPQTFAVGFWANREKSGSTLTLYEDIVSSDSEDEGERAPPSGSRRSMSGYQYSCQQQLGKRASVDSRSSYKYAIDTAPISMSNMSNQNINTSASPRLPPENNAVNKMQYCQEWLRPQQPHQSTAHVPIIGNVGTANYNRLQSSSKWDARNKLSHTSTTFSSNVKTTTVVNIYNSVQQKTCRSETVLRPTQLYPTSSFPNQNNNENIRPDSQMSNKSSDSSHSAGGRRSRPSSVCSVGSAGSRPSTPSNEQRGPPMSPNLRSKPPSPASHRRYSSQGSIQSPTHSTAGRHTFSQPASYESAERMRRMSGNKQIPPAAERSISHHDSPHPVLRSNSADSLQLERSKSIPTSTPGTPGTPSTVYKTEVHINMSSPFSTPKPDHHIPPIPVPRRSVARTKSSVTPRPHTMHHNMLYSHQEAGTADYQNMRRISTGSLHSQQHNAADSADSETSDSDSDDDALAATNVNLFNINSAAIVAPKPTEPTTHAAPNCDTETAAETQRNQRNILYHQPESSQNNNISSSAVKPEQTKKISQPEIMPRSSTGGQVSPPPDYVNITPPAAVSVSSQSENVTPPITSHHTPVATAQTYLREMSPVYDNLIPYNNNHTVSTAVTSDHLRSQPVTTPDTTNVYENVETSVGGSQPSSRSGSVEKEITPSPPTRRRQPHHQLHHQSNGSINSNSCWDNSTATSVTVRQYQTQCAQVCTYPSHHHS